MGNLNTLGDIKAYYRKLVDEPDESFLTDADVELYLGLGEEEYQNFIAAIDPQAMMNEATLIFAGTDFYQLSGANATILFGAEAAIVPVIQGRLIRCESLYEIALTPATSLKPTREWSEVATVNDLIETVRDSWTLVQGATPRIQLNRLFTGTLVLRYLGESVTDWSVDATEFTFKFNGFRDVIALMATVHYDIRDAGMADRAAARLAERKAQLEDAVFRRMYSASDRVRNENYQGMGA